MPLVELTFVYILLFFASVTVATRKFPGASGLLLGLKLFELVPNASDLGKGGAPGAKGASPNAALAGLITDLSRAHAHSRPLTVRDLRALLGQLTPFNDAAGLLFAVLLQLLFGEALSRLLARGPSPFLVCLSAFCLAQAARTLLPTVLAPFSVQGQMDRNQRTFVLALMGLLAVVFALLLSTPGLDVDVAMGARALHDTEAFWAGVGATLGQIGTFVTSGRLPRSGGGVAQEGGDEDAGDAFVNGGADKTEAEAQQVGKRYVVPLTLILAFTTGPFAALLVLPLLRAARCAWAVLHPSFEASIEEHSPGASAGMPLSAPAATRAAIALAAVAPAFALLLWVTPVAEGLLGLDATERAAAQGAALMLSGIAQLLCLRPLLQGYFNTAHSRWYRAAHSAAPPAARKALAQQTGALTGNTNALFPSVVVQLAMPPVAMVILGCLLWHAAAWRRPDPPEASAEELAFRNVLTDFLNPHPHLLRVAAGAAGCAAAGAHAVTVLTGMSLCRIGAMGQ